VGIRLASVIVGTIVNGSLLVLISIGFVVIFRATRVASFAQGGFAVLGGLIFYTLTQHGFSLIPGLLIDLLILFLLSGIVFRVILARIMGAPHFVTAIGTIGLASLLEAIAIMIWGDTPIAIRSNVLSIRSFTITSSFMTNDVGVFTVASAAVVSALLILGLQRTKVGLHMRLVADNTTLAAYSGISITRISVLAWGIGGAAAALSGVAFMLATESTPDSVYGLGLLAFPAILLGGLDSIAGAVIGGFIVAFLDQMSGTYIGGIWQDVIGYMVLLAILGVRPYGLFGTPEVRRL
jgi:branched-chain amino acid transport system permease protein